MPLMYINLSRYVFNRTQYSIAKLSYAILADINFNSIFMFHMRISDC